MSTRKVITSLFIGAAAGAVLGILLAPDKGSETRKKISRKGSDFAEGLKSKIEGFFGNDASGFEYDGRDRFDAYKESANHSFH